MRWIKCGALITYKALRLARTRDRAVRPPGRNRGAVRSLGAAIGLRGSGRRNLEVLHVDQGLLARVATRTTDFDLLLVRDDVEGNKQEQVRSDGCNSSESSEFLARAIAHVGSPREVG